jgi:hypothetical protein
MESCTEIIVACCEAQVGATRVAGPALGQSHLHLHNLFCAYPPQFRMFLHLSCLGQYAPPVAISFESEPRVYPA